jgi:hypothetical protein
VKNILIAITVLSLTNSAWTRDCSINTEIDAPEASSLADITDTVNAHMTADAPAEPDPTPEVSRRFTLFRMEKDYHAKNVLHYGVNVNTPSCTIVKTTNGAPSFNNYWIMGEEDNRKKLMTKDDLKRVGPIVLSHSDHEVRFKMKSFNDLKLNKKEVTIEANVVNGECKVTASIELNDGRKMNVSRIFANMSYFLGVPTGVDSLVIDGTDRSNGSRINLKMDN